MLKNWNPRQGRTPISMITSKYDETFFSQNVRNCKTGCNI